MCDPLLSFSELTHHSCYVHRYFGSVSDNSSDIYVDPYYSTFTFSTPSCYASWTQATNSFSSLLGANTPPAQCPQASITGSLCTALKDAYVQGENINLFPTDAMKAREMYNLQFSQGYLSIEYDDAGARPTTFWPTMHSFAPGCTLGCGRCAVTVIKLAY